MSKVNKNTFRIRWKDYFLAEFFDIIPVWTICEDSAWHLPEARAMRIQSDLCAKGYQGVTIF